MGWIPLPWIPEHLNFGWGDDGKVAKGIRLSLTFWIMLLLWAWYTICCFLQIAPQLSTEVDPSHIWVWQLWVQSLVLTSQSHLLFSWRDLCHWGLSMCMCGQDSGRDCWVEGEFMWAPHPLHTFERRNLCGWIRMQVPYQTMSWCCSHHLSEVFLLPHHGAVSLWWLGACLLPYSAGSQYFGPLMLHHDL